LGEDTLSATSIVNMRIVWNTIHTNMGKSLINHSLFETKKHANLLDVEPLLVEQSWDLSLQIPRDLVGGHAIDSNDTDDQH
jgi:hypothetical protein